MFEFTAEFNRISELNHSDSDFTKATFFELL